MYNELRPQFGLLGLQISRLQAGDGLIEAALTQHDSRVDAWYQEQLDALTSTDPGDREFIEYLFHEQKADAADAYPNILRSALFGTAYGIFESFLVSLCKRLEPHSEGPKLRELRGEGIQRAKLYLTKVARIPFPETREWSRLATLGLLRNALVHAQGDMTGNEHFSAIQALQQEMGCFTITLDRSAVRLEEGFNVEVLATMAIFAEQLDEGIRRQA